MILDKLRYSLSLLDSNELLVLVAAILIYHLVIVVVIYATIRGTVSLRERSLEAERDEYKKRWEHRDDAKKIEKRNCVGYSTWKRRERFSS